MSRKKQPQVEAPVQEDKEVEAIVNAAKKERARQKFPFHVAALACYAKKPDGGGFARDTNDNEAVLNHDGTVRLSIAQKKGGHRRVNVRVPEEIELEVVFDDEEPDPSEEPDLTPADEVREEVASALAESDDTEEEETDGDS